MSTCKHCKEAIHDDATHCPHCGQEQVGTLEGLASLGCALAVTWPLWFIILFILWVTFT